MISDADIHWCKIVHRDIGAWLYAQTRTYILHLTTSPTQPQVKCVHIRNNVYALLPHEAVKDKGLLQKLHEKG